MKKLALKKETLADLTTDDLRAVAGGGNGQSVSCAITYTCVSNNCFNSITCTGISNGCTVGTDKLGGC
jgi:hypothetical protein